MIEFSDFVLEHTTDYDDMFYDDEDDDYRDDNNTNKNRSIIDEASKCQFDILTIEEYDSGGTLIQSKKHCGTMPKPINTTNAVTVKFVYSYKKESRSIFIFIHPFVLQRF